MKSPSNSVRRARPLLGTVVEIRLHGTCANGLARAAHVAFAAVEQVHRLMNFHDPGSDVSRLNRLAHREAVAVHPWTYQVLETARAVWLATAGLFDCTLAPLLVGAGYLPSLRENVVETGDMRAIALLPDRLVRFERPLCIDLGGIAKGFAVDRAVDSLRDGGIRQGAVNAGGDLRLFGPAKEPVHVRDPRHPGDLVLIGEFKEVSVATSAAYYSRKQMGSRWVAPIADPRGPALRDFSRSVTVIAQDCAIADALTKPVALTGDAHLPCLGAYSAIAHVMDAGTA